MKTLEEIKSVIEKEGDLVITKPESLTNGEWRYFNMIASLKTKKLRMQNQILSIEKQIEDLEALYNEF